MKAEIHNINTLNELDAFVKYIAPIFEKGDLLALNGEIGSGKTTLTKHLINYLTATRIDEINSPTFNLCQTYSKEDLIISHYDFYRLDYLQEIEELDINDSIKNNFTIIEWANKFSSILPKDHIEIQISNKSHQREYKILFHGEYAKKIAAHKNRLSFLSNSNFNIKKITNMKGDASKRKYYRVNDGKENFVLMDASEDSIKETTTSKTITDFIVFGQYLENIGLRVPKIYEFDIQKHLILEEDLGLTTYDELYSKLSFQDLINPAIESLLILVHSNYKNINDLDGRAFEPQNFDEKVFINESKIFIDYYWPYVKNSICPEEEKYEFLSIIEKIYSDLSTDKTLVLRDYHSPNLHYLQNEKGHRKCALIDFQDALLGHPLYDLVSLAQDARFTISEDQERYIVDTFEDKFLFNDFQLSKSSFNEQYKILAIQRSLKILGIFARLYLLEGKNNYIIHMPRVVDYIRRSMDCSLLHNLTHWLKINFKDIFDV
ncbi:MAG: tRNA (adenosine(37)-N6)-threonylcarbamoyltransferase complex ATPase subunit type 1 TsaE [Hyphomicrobiales bacterium]